MKYCWWKKSCTTWDVKNPVNNGINYLSTSAGFLPSTVVMKKGVKRRPSVESLGTFLGWKTQCLVGFTCKSRGCIKCSSTILVIPLQKGCIFSVIPRKNWLVSRGTSCVFRWFWQQTSGYNTCFEGHLRLLGDYQSTQREPSMTWSCFALMIFGTHTANKYILRTCLRKNCILDTAIALTFLFCDLLDLPLLQGNRSIFSHHFFVSKKCGSQQLVMSRPDFEVGKT